MKKLRLFIFAIILLSPIASYGEGIQTSAPDLSIYQNIKGFNDYKNEAIQQNNYNYLMLQQAESLRLQNEAQQAQQLPDQRTQLFVETADNIDVKCQEMRRSGVYKTYLATNQQCTTPQILKLAEQMNRADIETIKNIMQYSASLAKRIDLGEISEEEAFQLLNNYNPNN